MGDNNWIIENLRKALDMWNNKLGEIWALMSQSPESFKGGAVWDVMADINGALKAIGYGLLVLFFVMGVMKTAGSFVELKRPEAALKLFIRFALAEAAITFCMDIRSQGQKSGTLYHQANGAHEKTATGQVGPIEQCAAQRPGHYL